MRRGRSTCRRTLQNRMREYQLPPGRGGRPKAELTYQPTAGLTLGNITAAALLIGGGYLVGRWLARPGSDKQIVTGAAVLGAL